MAIHNLWCIKVHSKHSTVLLLCLLQNLMHQRLCSVLSWHHVGLFQMANYVYYEIECIKHYMDFTQMHWKTASLTAFTIHLKSSWTSKISLSLLNSEIVRPISKSNYRKTSDYAALGSRKTTHICEACTSQNRISWGLDVLDFQSCHDKALSTE